jgi:hypothetical protein
MRVSLLALLPLSIVESPPSLPLPLVVALPAPPEPVVK